MNAVYMIHGLNPCVLKMFILKKLLFFFFFIEAFMVEMQDQDKMACGPLNFSLQIVNLKR